MLARSRRKSSARTQHRSRTPLDPRSAGEARVGQELTASEGTWTGNPTSFSFQWQRCNIDAITCLDVTGATGRTYGVRLADLGFRLRVQVAHARMKRSGTATSLPDGGRSTDHSGHERAPDASDSQGHVPGAKIYVRFRVCDDRPRTSASWSARRALAFVRHCGALPRVSRRVRAVRTRGAGYLLSVFVALAGTRSRCVRRDSRG